MVITKDDEAPKSHPHQALMPRHLSLKIATINTNGWNDSKALRGRQIVEKYHLDILFVTETKVNIDCIIPGKGRTLLGRGKSTSTTGVAAIWPKGKPWTIVSSSSRIIHVVHSSGITVMGVYAPNEQACEENRIKFWDEMEAVIMVLPTKSPLIVIGDLNCGHEESRHPSVFGDQTNFQLVAKMASRQELEIQNHGPTWVSPYSASRNKAAPSRTLDRCLIRFAGHFVSDALVDFDLRVADHGVLFVQAHFFDLPRDSGRPHNAPDIPAIDLQWLSLKRGLQFHVDPAIPLDTVNEFWRAKHMLELEERCSLEILDDCGKVLPSDKGVELVRDYLYTLWGAKYSSWSSLLRSEGTPSSPPTEDEVIQAISKLKANTALGRDRISAREVKANVKAPGIYQKILGYVWKLQRVPTAWKEMRIKPIPKVSSPASPKAIRPITCLSTSAKVLNNVIIARCNNLYECKLHEDQHGYRKNHSVETAVNQLIESVNLKHGKRLVAFIDITKAYDSVSKDGIAEALNRWMLPDTEHNLIVEQYLGSSIFVEINGSVATPFALEKGIRQGCALSCLLFSLIMAIAHCRFKCIFDCLDIGMISYSDDVVLHCSDKKLLRRGIKALNGVLGDFGLSINTEKTTFFEFNNEATVEDSVTWLGFELTTRLTWEKYLSARLTKVQAASKVIKHVLSRKRLDLRACAATLIVQGMIGSYIRIPSFVKLDTNQAERLLNEVMRVICSFVVADESKALKKARIMLGSKELEGPLDSSPMNVLQCTYCEKSIRNEAGMRQHLLFCKRNPDPDEAPKKRCPFCEKDFHTRGLKYHMKTCNS